MAHYDMYEQTSLNISYNWSVLHMANHDLGRSIIVKNIKYGQVCHCQTSFINRGQYVRFGHIWHTLTFMDKCDLIRAMYLQRYIEYIEQWLFMTKCCQDLPIIISFGQL
jgi:hypothetical protein